MQSTIAGASDGGNLTPPINNGSGADSQRTAGFAQPKALQLGGNKPDAKAVAAQLAEQVAAEENGHAAWTNNDLMDVNADEGDWSKSLHLLKRVLFSLVSSFFQVRLRVRLPARCPGSPRRLTLALVLRAQVPQRVRRCMCLCGITR